jgi:hypothetical protein
MTEMLAVAKLMAHQTGTAVPLTRQRGTPISSRPLVLIPLVMAGESPSLFGLGVGDGVGSVRTFVCANPVNRDEQYDMLAAAMKAIEPTALSWEVSPEETPQIVVPGADSARLVLGIIDRSVYSQQPALVKVAQRLSWFDQRSDYPDSASMLVLPRVLSTCLATGQGEFGDLHLGACLEWCKPPDGKIWACVAAVEQWPASGSTAPSFDRADLSPAVEAYTAAVAAGDAPAARRAKNIIDGLIRGEVERRYELVKTALRVLRGFVEADVAAEIGAEDRRSFLKHVEYVADPTHFLRRGVGAEMQTTEFMSREFVADRIAGLSIRSVSSAYEKARLSGDLLEGTVIQSISRKVGRVTVITQTIASVQQLSVRADDKLVLLNDDRIGYRTLDLARDPATGNIHVRVEVISGKRSANLPIVGNPIALGPAGTRPHSSYPCSWDRLGPDSSDAAASPGARRNSRNPGFGERGARAERQTVMAATPIIDITNPAMEAVRSANGDTVTLAPPGAGKTSLLVDLTALTALMLLRTALVAAVSNNQCDDITYRAATMYPRLRIDRFVASGSTKPALSRLPNVRVIDSVDDLSAPIVVGSVMKFAEIKDLGYRADELFIDEAYQARRADYDRIRALADKAFLIGDPGQIRPIYQSDIRLYAADPCGPHVAAPRVLLNNGTALRLQMRHSRRLPQDTVDIIQPSFYPQLAFTALAGAGQRRITGGLKGMTPLDRVLDAALLSIMSSSAWQPMRSTACSSGSSNSSMMARRACWRASTSGWSSFIAMRWRRFGKLSAPMSMSRRLIGFRVWSAWSSSRCILCQVPSGSRALMPRRGGLASRSRVIGSPASSSAGTASDVPLTGPFSKKNGILAAPTTRFTRVSGHTVR